VVTMTQAKAAAAAMPMARERATRRMYGSRDIIFTSGSSIVSTPIYGSALPGGSEQVIVAK
jgi:hypothetical protein